MIIFQIALLVGWYAVPWMAAVPWWVIWFPSIVLFLDCLFKAWYEWVEDNKP